MDANLRNLKDFLTLYNKITEICFSRCVNNIFDRNLSPYEHTCVDNCVLKFARFNQNMMKVYVEVQTEINQKRVQELEENQRLQEQQQQQIKQTQEPIKSDTAVEQQSGTQNAFA